MEAMPEWHKAHLCLCAVAVWGYRLTHNLCHALTWTRRLALCCHALSVRQTLGGCLYSRVSGPVTFLFAACLHLRSSVQQRAFSNSIRRRCSRRVNGSHLARGLRRYADGRTHRQARADVIVLKTGLWAWSRHPNYLGEISWWWGVWFFSLSAPDAPWLPGIAGPLSITFLFTAISVKLIEDRQLDNKGEHYRQYTQETPSSLLLLPPQLGRHLGAWMYSDAPPPMS